MNDAILNLILQFKHKKILVIGDFILDSFIQGNSSRISPEAPVPVLDVHSQAQYLGGAGNVAANLTALGATVLLCTVVGEDLFEKDVKPLLYKHNINAKYLVHDDERKTEVKTRLVAQQHTIVRFDVGDKSRISESSEGLLIDLLVEAYEEADAVLIADYEKGVVTKNVILALKQLQEKHSKFIAVDSKRLSVFKELKPALVKPNYKQAIDLLKLTPVNNRVEQVLALKSKLLNKTNATLVALTLDVDGAVWLAKGEKPLHTLAKHAPGADVCGAGDTYISMATLAIISGATKLLAAQIAGIAANCVIEKQGTAVCKISEIIERTNDEMKVLDTKDMLAIVATQLRESGKRIVFTNGCFDILHCGHTRYLQEAKSLGDILILGVNTDESVRRLKGNGRPINLLQDRMDVLAAFSSVDFVISFGGGTDRDNPTELIRLIKPNIVVKGENYKLNELPELEVISEIGAKLIQLPLTYGKSTTNIIRRIRGNAFEDRIAKLKAL